MRPKKKYLLVLLATAGILVNGLQGKVMAVADESVQQPIQMAVHQVSQGDCLWDISSKYNVAVSEIQEANGLTGTTIRIGQSLKLPHTRAYDIKPGDNLSILAAQNNLSVEELKRANDLESDLIRPGQRLIVPNLQKPAIQQAFASREQKTQTSYSTIRIAENKGYVCSEDEIYLLAKLIHAEARGESLEGKIAVGAVIVNRLRAREFPKTIREIILQKNSEVYQFSPVEDGSINLEPNSSAWEAAKAAISGEDPTNGSVFFYNPEIATDSWIKTLPVTKVIGNHVFAR